MTTGSDRRYDLHDQIEAAIQADKNRGFIRVNSEGAILVQDLSRFVEALAEHNGQSSFIFQDSKTGKIYELKEFK